MDLCLVFLVVVFILQERVEAQELFGDAEPAKSPGEDGPADKGVAEKKTFTPGEAEPLAVSLSTAERANIKVSFGCGCCCGYCCCCCCCCCFFSIGSLAVLL